MSRVSALCRYFVRRKLSVGGTPLLLGDATLACAASATSRMIGYPRASITGERIYERAAPIPGVTPRRIAVPSSTKSAVVESALAGVAALA